MSSSQKQIGTALILVAFLTLAIFSFTIMTRGTDGSMQGDCPFSLMGAMLCPQDALAAVAHHISAFQSFLNAAMSSSATALIIALLALVCAALLFWIWPLLYKPPEYVRYVLNTPLATSQDRATIRWLSLLENSPATL